MSDVFGPFSVDPVHLVGLGGRMFQELISRLLVAESAGLSGPNIHTSYQDNVGDRGVDAGLYAAEETEWIPAGDSAWQFKAGDLSPKECADELAGATRALEVIKQGGKYRLVLGKALEDYLIDAREEKLREEAEKLGIDVSGDRFKVIDGNQLARWLERYPALATARALRGTGAVAIGFERWGVSQAHQATWVASTARDELRSAILDFLGQSSKLDLRIEGVSGLGKTRGVLEALRNSKYEPLVLYVGDADDLNYPLIDHLTVQKRTAVLVIDECTRQRHKVFAEQIEVGSPIRLISIGERDTDSTHTLPIQISALPDEVIDQVLTQNQPTLWPEARRTVVANCAGNVRWALLLSDAVLRNPKANAGDLLGADAIGDIVLGMLAGEMDFLAYSALALFSRYGLDGEKRAELELIAAGLDIPVQQLLDANRKLEQLGLVTKHGRFRSITPQPLAVLLASRGWEQLGDRILDMLLPSLDASLAERLFLRAADIGSTGPAAVALNRILGENGPFASLQGMAEGSSSRLLIQLAIICPSETTAHLDALFGDATDDELRELKSIRRDLVWTLEKLVWHSTTFKTAAGMLLRLALVENETFSNNASGTWIGLFGGMLPATAASPSARMAYLERLTTDQSSAVRKLAVAAADHALDVRSTVTVSGELQGGAIVEPRGTPKTYGELWTYIKSAIQLLRVRATDDADAEIREAATEALVGAIHPMLENPNVREELFDALAALPDDSRLRVQTAIKHLQAVFDQVETPEFAAATNKTHDTAARRAGLNILVARLPEPGVADELQVLAAGERWEWKDGELERKIVDVARSLPPGEATQLMFQLLSGHPPAQASYELGVALHAVASDVSTLASLADLAQSGNVAGLVGYLYGSVQAGDEDAFDSFLDGELGQQLDDKTRLTITVRGPKSTAGWTRALDLMRSLPVHVAAPRLFGWHVEIEEDQIAAMLADWLPRIETQQDYNACVDMTAMMVWRRSPPLGHDIERLITDLVSLRSEFGEVGRQSSRWLQLAQRRLSDNPSALLTALIEQIDAGSLHAYEGSQERKLLQEAISAAGPAGLDPLLAKLDSGSWRLRMDLQGWITTLYPAGDLIGWVDQSPDRARLVASLVGIADGQPSEVVQFLLTDFGNDNQVSSSLYRNFVTGSWSGNESVRLSSQITQLESWVGDPRQSGGVKRWAREVIAVLKRRREVVLLEEAEEDR